MKFEIQDIKDKFIIAKKFTSEDGLVTPTLKLKKDKIYELYKDKILNLYR